MTDSKANEFPDAPEGIEINQITRKLFSSEDTNWRELLPYKKFTNAFILDKKNGRMLLGLKKRGFGKDMYNGFGGKIEPGETPLEAAVRELKEESGVTAKLKECGVLLFVNASPEYCYYVHMYRTYEYDDEPIETEEMRPQWFAIPPEYLDKDKEGGKLGKETSTSMTKSDDGSGVSYPPIPFELMWPDDELWMPLLLQGSNFFGRVDFDQVDSKSQKGSYVMERWWFGSRD